MSAFNNPLAQPFDPGTGKDLTPTKGREDGQGVEGDSGLGTSTSTSSCHCTSRKGGVVIRATVEHTGLVGDTELTVNVKWPASTFCVPKCEKPAAQASSSQDTQQVPANGPLADLGTL